MKSLLEALLFGILVSIPLLDSTGGATASKIEMWKATPDPDAELPPTVKFHQGDVVCLKPAISVGAVHRMVIYDVAPESDDDGKMTSTTYLYWTNWLDANLQLQSNKFYEFELSNCP